jgi:hypothetical protein
MRVRAGVAAGCLLIGLCSLVPPARAIERDEAGAADQKIVARLERRVVLIFRGARLEEVLAAVKTIGARPGEKPIPLTVDLGGLEDVGVTLATRITFESRDSSLKDALRTLLGYHRLGYQVEGGRLRIVAKPRAPQLLDREPKTKAIRAALEKRVSLHFDKIPLAVALEIVKKTTAGAKDKGIPIYVDPVALQEVEVTLNHPVSIAVDDVPLKTSLRTILEPLSLTYEVKDGLLTITSNVDDIESPEPARNRGAKTGPR